MKRLLKAATLILVFNQSLASGVNNFNWIIDNNGNWFDPNNWVEGAAPIDGIDVSFGVGNNDFSRDEVDTDNFSNGVSLPNTRLILERKVTFSDASAMGDPSLADDGMVFDVMNINGTGGGSVIFNVPVTANTMSSNRHGGIFNREITVDTILATSNHQDGWQINGSATGPISYVLIDENRGPDGGDTNGSFRINSDLTINLVEHVWGRMRVGINSITDVRHYFYSDYTNELENNNINPINIDGILNVGVFTVYDTASDSIRGLAVGSYGNIDNETADFQTDFIVGEGLLVVNLGDQIFNDSFEFTCELTVPSESSGRGCW